MAKVPVEFTPEHIRANSSPSDLYRPFLASNEPVASLLRTDFHVSARRGLGVHSRDAGQLRDGEAPGLDLRDETLYYNTRGEAEKYWAGKDLPRPTKDIRRLRHDLKTWGYCLIEEALSSEQLARVQKRVYDQAVGERRAGIAIFTGANPAPGQEIPAVQMLHTLYNKGSQFCGILSHNPADVQAGPLIEQLLADTIGPDWILTSFIAIITSRGNIPQNLHQDQAIAPHQSMEGPFSCNTMYAIDDFTADNGGTLVIPGSHLIASKSLRITEPLPPAINLHCPAGTGIVFEGRLLHGTGVNRTHKTRAMIVADARKPFMRQQELHFASVARDVLESAPPKLLYRLGFLPSRILGGVEGDWYGDSYLVGQRLLLESGKFEPVRQLGPESSDEELKKDYNFRHSQLGVRMVKYQGEATDKVKEKFRDTKPAWKAPPKAMF